MVKYSEAITVVVEKNKKNTINVNNVKDLLG